MSRAFSVALWLSAAAIACSSSPRGVASDNAGPASGGSGDGGSSIDSTMDAPVNEPPRNLALHRAAYQSSSANDDNTAHLATDGVVSADPTNTPQHTDSPARD